ncbi:MAG: hypothetical protein ACRDNS_34700, partial [Trebonia sp.]
MLVVQATFRVRPEPVADVIFHDRGVVWRGLGGADAAETPCISVTPVTTPALAALILQKSPAESWATSPTYQFAPPLAIIAPVGCFRAVSIVRPAEL